MLKQQIDALKLAQGFHQLSIKSGSRHSLLDYIALLYINEHKGCGQLDIVEFLFYDRVKCKSSLDKPLSRLESCGLIKRNINDGVVRKNGDPLFTYSVDKKGDQFLKRSAFSGSK